MAVTLKDIAEKAKVSRPAVSLFLNNQETKHVSAENKKRIKEAINQLGYRSELRGAQLARRFDNDGRDCRRNVFRACS